jgi:hypothetical protein
MKLKCNFALSSLQELITFTLKNNVLKNGTHYKSSISVA